MDERKYSVLCDFADGSQEYVERNATLDEVVDSFTFYVSCFGARIGSIQRVAITDQDDIVSLEWTYGKGLTRKPVVSLKVDVSVPASELV